MLERNVLRVELVGLRRNLEPLEHLARLMRRELERGDEPSDELALLGLDLEIRPRERAHEPHEPHPIFRVQLLEWHPPDVTRSRMRA